MLNMKRLLGLLLVMGMVGCGEEIKTVDASATVERDGLTYEINSETPFTGVVAHKYGNGQKGGKKLTRMGSVRGYLLCGTRTGGRRRN